MTSLEQGEPGRVAIDLEGRVNSTMVAVAYKGLQEAWRSPASGG